MKKSLDFGKQIINLEIVSILKNEHFKSRKQI